MILDRDLMWDAPKVYGCQSHYNFKTGTFRSRAMNKSIALSNFAYRIYPCPFRGCYCARSHLHAQMGDNSGILVEPVDRKYIQLSIKQRKGEAVVQEEAEEGKEEEGREDPENVLESDEAFILKIETYLRQSISDTNFIPPFLL
jgi:hypothetical protein